MSHYIASFLFYLPSQCNVVTGIYYISDFCPEKGHSRNKRVYCKIFRTHCRNVTLVFVKNQYFTSL